MALFGKKPTLQERFDREFAEEQADPKQSLSVKELNRILKTAAEDGVKLTAQPSANGSYIFAIDGKQLNYSLMVSDEAKSLLPPKPPEPVVAPKAPPVAATPPAPKPIPEFKQEQLMEIGKMVSAALRSQDPRTVKILEQFLGGNDAKAKDGKLDDVEASRVLSRLQSLNTKPEGREQIKALSAALNASIENNVDAILRGINVPELGGKKPKNMHLAKAFDLNIELQDEAKRNEIRPLLRQEARNYLLAGNTVTQAYEDLQVSFYYQRKSYDPDPTPLGSEPAQPDATKPAPKRYVSADRLPDATKEERVRLLPLLDGADGSKPDGLMTTKEIDAAVTQAAKWLKTPDTWQVVDTNANRIIEASEVEARLNAGLAAKAKQERGGRE